MDQRPGLGTALDDARAGSQAALGVLWQHLSPVVCGYLRARGAADAEATTNEVFLGAFSALGDFAGDIDGFRGLLFTIAQRRLVDEHRRRSRRPAEVEWTPELDERQVESAEHCALVGQGAVEARALLDTLPPDQKDVLMLRIFGDLTVDQIAAVLGKSSGAVKQLQRRGLQSLRRRMGLADVPDVTSGRS